MAAIIEATLSSQVDYFEEEWELAVDSFKIPFDSKKESVESVESIFLEKILPKKENKNEFKITPRQSEIYKNYNNFIYGLIGTMAKTFFSVVEIKEGKKLIIEKLASSEIPLKTFVIWIRNDYLVPLFNVARSTIHYNPIQRKWIVRKTTIDPNLTQVKRDDQLKFYKLFNFRGLLNGQSIIEDSNREKIINFLKDIIYGDLQNLVYFVKTVFHRICIEITLNQDELISICNDIRFGENYNIKNYSLPIKWHHHQKVDK